MSDNMDHLLSIVLIASCAIYLYFAIQPVYGGRRMARLLRALVLTVGATAIVLLLLTLYSA